MIYREIVHTCSNSDVARAAIQSIGGEFARRFADDASRRNLTAGAWGARLVREFASNADEIALREVDTVAQGADHPILCGLRHILERGVRKHRASGTSEDAMPAWMIAATRSAA